MTNYKIFTFILLLLLAYSVNIVFAHCDTMDGPVIADAKRSIENNNINYALKWVRTDDENQIREAFSLIMKVRTLSPEAKDLSEKYFFETLVRLHRNGEGVPYTGVKPSGTPIDEKILAADNSLAKGDLSPLKDLVPADMLPELTKRFEKALSLKKFDVNNVEAGREFVEAYVQFFHFAEGENEGHEHIDKIGHAGHLTTLIPWTLTGVFFILSVVMSVRFLRVKKK